MKKGFAFLFLVGFFLIRVANVHAITHAYSHEDPAQCEQCDLIAHANEATPLDVGPVSSGIPFVQTFVLLQRKLKDYVPPIQKTLYSDYFHNKPPPAYLMG